MLNPKIEAALNDQIQAEFYSAYLYLSMSAQCEGQNLPGFSAWMRRQAQEEVSHGLKIFDYLNDQSARVKLQAVSAPPVTFPSMQAMWEGALAHEREISEHIDRLYALARQENDFASQAMLQWFVTEQVEEVKTASRILEQVKMIGSSSSALFFLDRHVGKDENEG